MRRLLVVQAAQGVGSRAIVLLCTMRIGAPCSANSRSQKVRARNPRSSSWRSTSIRNAPASRAGLKITAPAALIGAAAHQPARSTGRRQRSSSSSRPRLLELADPVDPQVAAAGELIEGEAVARRRRAAARRRDARSTGARTAAAPGRSSSNRPDRSVVRPAAGRERCARPGHDLLDDLGQVADAVVPRRWRRR